MNRKTKRQIANNLKKLDKDSRADALMAMQQHAVDKALMKVTPDLVLAGQDANYKYLYKQFVEPMGKSEGSSTADVATKMAELVNHIIEKYGKILEKENSYKKFIKDDGGNNEVQTPNE